ncbi:Glycerophosphocholine phosphodiesterase [Chytridiales sp. JEL 0842]|nr:Glycerophosphocholine phosphodiesterase [Chytridiales sp. JEL 0842]
MKGTDRVLAVAHSGPLSRSRPVSLWRERDPLGGRLFLPFVATAPLKEGGVSIGDCVGEITLEFVVVTYFEHPLADVPSGTDVDTWTGVKLVGHRGMGMNLPVSNSKGGPLQIGENTVESFTAAGKLGAVFVEFDAQLSRDHVVVLYHDFHLDDTGLPIAVNDLTAEQFLNMKPAIHPSLPTLPTKNPIRRTRSYGDLPGIGISLTQKSGIGKLWPWKGNGDGTIQEPFTTLKEALQKVPIEIGFNIEIKYPLLFESEKERLDVAECNKFVDAILKDTFDYAGERQIVFSSFHVEACRMAKLKQSRYPVFFLTMGGVHWTPDARCNSVDSAIHFAQLAGLQGIVSDAKPLIESPDLVDKIKSSTGLGARKGLKVLTYGGANIIPGNAKLLKDAGIDGVIVDRVKQVAKELGLQ